MIEEWYLELELQNLKAGLSHKTQEERWNKENVLALGKFHSVKRNEW